MKHPAKASPLEGEGIQIMLKCGECTFFKEPEEGTRGQCGHPEKYTLIGDVMQRGICEYEDDCRYGYPDIWAARGAARLVRIQKAPASQINSSTTDLFSPNYAGLATHHYLKKKI